MASPCFGSIRRTWLKSFSPSPRFPVATIALARFASISRELGFRSCASLNEPFAASKFLSATSIRPVMYSTSAVSRPRISNGFMKYLAAAMSPKAREVAAAPSHAWPDDSASATSSGSTFERKLPISERFLCVKSSASRLLGARNSSTVKSSVFRGAAPANRRRSASSNL